MLILYDLRLKIQVCFISNLKNKNKILVCFINKSSLIMSSKSKCITAKRNSKTMKNSQM